MWDHYVRLASLLGVSASQSSSLVPLHSFRVMSIHPERTFERLRYSLGGDRPSQTTRLALSACRVTVRHEKRNHGKVVFHRCLPLPARRGSSAPTYAT